MALGLGTPGTGATSTPSTDLLDTSKPRRLPAHFRMGLFEESPRCSQQRIMIANPVVTLETAIRLQHVSGSGLVRNGRLKRTRNRFLSQVRHSEVENAVSANVYN